MISLRISQSSCHFSISYIVHLCSQRMHIFPAGFGPLLVVLILLCITLSVTSAAKAQQTKSTVCPPGTKPNSTSLVHGSATGCVPLSNRDVSHIFSMYFYQTRSCKEDLIQISYTRMHVVEWL